MKLKVTRVLQAICALYSYSLSTSCPLIPSEPEPQEEDGEEPFVAPPGLIIPSDVELVRFNNELQEREQPHGLNIDYNIIIQIEKSFYGVLEACHLVVAAFFFLFFINYYLHVN